MRTFIKWQGNKSKHINKFIHLFPDEYNTYIEPFVGSGAVLLKLQPKKWIINDFNKDLIEIWKLIRDNPDKIIKQFKKFEKIFIKLSNEEKLKYCKELIKKLETLKYTNKRSILYLFISNSSYLSNLIINNKLTFKMLDLNIYLNNKYSFFKEKYYDNLNKISDFLENGKIFNNDYKNILKKARKNDFIFLDPPYIENHIYDFNYNKGEQLDNNFINDLLKECKKLDKKGVKWLMTQADTKEIRLFFKDYNIDRIKVYRRVRDRHVYELIIRNY